MKGGGTVDKGRQENIFDETVKRMTELGTYRPDFNVMIAIYVQMLDQYAALTIRFEESGYETETPSAAGTQKKSSIYAALESLRKDILAYSDRLGLNPRSHEKMKGGNQKRESALDRALGAFDSG